MKRLVSMFGLGLMIAIVVSQSAVAEAPLDSYPVGASSQDGGVTPFATNISSFLPGRTWVELNLADNGLGYDGAYGSLGGKMRLFQDMFDGRWLGEAQANLALNDGGFFGNVGIERVFSIESAPADVVFGVFYDIDDSGDGNFIHALNQGGVSGAIKTKKFDVRANGYFPFGNTEYDAGGLRGEKGFIGKNFALRGGIDSALEGFDTELRIRPYWLTMLNGTLDVGGYQYSSDVVDSFAGARVRLGLQAFRGGRVSMEVTHDQRFETTGVLQLGWHFGGQGGPGGHEYSQIGSDLDPTIRQDHITRYNHDTILAIDPDTGAPYRFHHVDNTAAAGGSGAVGSRFRTLAAAEAASSTDDIVFVYEGDGTSTGYDTGFVMKDGQMLLGDGVAHSIPLPGGRSTLLCNDTDGLRPALTNDGGDIVTLANRNTVAGLCLDGFDPANSGIVGVGVTGPTVIRDNKIVNLLVDGVRINGFSGDLTVTDNTFTNIDDDAVEITGITSQGNTLAFRTNTIDDADDNGIILAGFNVENTFVFDTNVMTNIGSLTAGVASGDGISLLNGANSIPGVGGSIAFFSNTITGPARRGISIVNVADPEAVIGFTGNTVTGAGSEGLAFIDSLGALSFNGDTFSGTTGGTPGSPAGSTGAGFLYSSSRGGTSSLQLTNFTATGNTIGFLANASNGTDLNIVANNNTFSTNVAHGAQLNALDAGASILLNSFAGNTLAGNGGRGLEINGADNSLISAVVVENSFTGNLQGGFVAESTGGTLNAFVGGFPRPIRIPGNPLTPAFKQNTFDANGGVGVGLVYRGDATGFFDINDNIVTSTVDDTATVLDPVSPFFNGEGIHVRFANNDTPLNSNGTLPVNAILGNSRIVGNTVGSLTNPALGNLSHGIHVFTQDETSIAALDILNNDVGNNLDGLNITAIDSSVINNVLTQGNVFTANRSDGINYSVSGGSRLNAITPAGIRNNTITSNAVNGIFLQIANDAQMNVDIADNFINANTNDGIGTAETVNVPADARFLTGQWTGNTITNNGANGINSLAQTQGLVVTGNTIDTNALYGVSIGSGGTAAYTNNLIARNGAGGAEGTGNSGGINIFDTALPFSENKTLAFNNNVIFSNIGDGARIVQNTATTWNVFFNNNTIEANTRRGINSLTQGSGQVLNLSITNNKIASNGLEGVLIANTSSTTQSLDGIIAIDAANSGMAQDGTVTASNTTNLIFTGNRVINNGTVNTTSASGLVILVGSNDGGRGITDDGGFFGDLPGGRGGIGATIRGNTFASNTGNDVTFEAFISTVAPTTGTTWDGTPVPPVFNPTGYQSDPLSRFDLVWGTNVFDPGQISVNNGTGYTNADGVFKSRLNTATPGGPFLSATRSRSITRLAARNVGPGGTQLAPGVNFGGSQFFLYPGMGQSTFRILPVSDPQFGAGGLVAQGFTFDTFYLDLTDQAGFWNILGGGPRPQ